MADEKDGDYEYPWETFYKQTRVKTWTVFRDLLRRENIVDTIDGWLEALLNIQPRWSSDNTEVAGPGSFSPFAQEPGETALQRFIYMKEKTNIAGLATRWLDIEVPLDFVPGRARRTCVDLLGYSAKQHLTVMTELKYVGSSAGASGSEDRLGDTPLFAVLEAIYYAHVGHGNQKELKKMKPHMFHRNSFGGRHAEAFLESAFENIMIVVVANKPYWERWRARLKKHNIDPCRLGEMRRSVEEKLSSRMPSVKGVKFLNIGDVRIPEVSISTDWTEVH